MSSPAIVYIALLRTDQLLLLLFCIGRKSKRRDDVAKTEYAFHGVRGSCVYQEATKSSDIWKRRGGNILPRRARTGLGGFSRTRCVVLEPVGAARTIV